MRVGAVESEWIESAMGQREERMRDRAALLAGLTLAALLVPLLFHRSPEAILGGFSAPYLTLLVGAAALALFLARAVGRACRARSSAAPLLGLWAALGAVALLGLLAEAALGIALRDRDTFSEYRRWGHRESLLFGFEPAPSNTWEVAAKSYSTDAHGFRTRTAAVPALDAARKRLFVLGGSSAFGFGRGDDETWVHQLEATLHERREAARGTAVVNAAANGFNSLQLISRYYLRVAPQKPTHVLFYGGHNDVQPFAMPRDGIWLTERILHARTLGEYWARETRGRNPYARSLLAFSFARLSGLVQGASPETLYRMDADSVYEPARELAAPGVVEHNGANFRRNVETLVMLIRRDGAVPVLTTYIHALPDTDRRRPALAHHNEILRALAREHSLPLVDLAARFEKARGERDASRWFYADGYHPADGASRFIAFELARALDPLP